MREEEDKSIIDTVTAINLKEKASKYEKMNRYKEAETVDDIELDTDG